MTFRIVQKPAIQFIGITVRTTNEAYQAMADIPDLWERFSKEEIFNQIPNKASDDVYALYTDYESDHNKPYTVLIGCAVSSVEEIPEGLEARSFPETSYAVFTAKGAFPKSIIEAWSTIWSTHLSRSYTGDFEQYTQKFHQGKSDEVDIYIAMKGGTKP